MHKNILQPVFPMKQASGKNQKKIQSPIYPPIIPSALTHAQILYTMQKYT